MLPAHVGNDFDGAFRPAPRSVVSWVSRSAVLVLVVVVVMVLVVVVVMEAWLCRLSCLVFVLVVVSAGCTWHAVLTVWASKLERSVCYAAQYK